MHVESLNVRSSLESQKILENKPCVYVQWDKTLNVHPMSGVIAAEVNSLSSDWAKLKGGRPTWSRPLQTVHQGDWAHNSNTSVEGNPSGHVTPHRKKNTLLRKDTQHYITSDFFVNFDCFRRVLLAGAAEQAEV